MGDIVLFRVDGNVFLHLVKAVEAEDDARRVLIGNNRGKVNGWTKVVYGKVVGVENP